MPARSEKSGKKGEKGEGLRIALWFHSLHEKMTSIDIMKNHTINYNNKLPKLTPNNNYYMFDNLFQLGDPSGDICGSDTTMGSPKARDKSFVVSVFPVPAGPAGAPPRHRFKALNFRGVKKTRSLTWKRKKKYIFTFSVSFCMAVNMWRKESLWFFFAKAIQVPSLHASPFFTIPLCHFVPGSGWCNLITQATWARINNVRSWLKSMVGKVAA